MALLIQSKSMLNLRYTLQCYFLAKALDSTVYFKSPGFGGKRLLSLGASHRSQLTVVEMISLDKAGSKSFAHF